MTVLPTGLLQNFLEGFALLGFVPRREAYTGRYQIFDFSPTAWLRGQLDELVFQFDPRKTQTAVEGYFEIDKKNKGLLGSSPMSWTWMRKRGASALPPPSWRPETRRRKRFAPFSNAICATSCKGRRPLFFLESGPSRTGAFISVC